MSAELSTNDIRSNDLLSRTESRLLIVDVQEKLLPAIPVAAELTENCRMLIQAARVLQVPVFATEQYPRGLGGTAPELTAMLDGPIPEKVCFSGCEALNWGMAADQADDRFRVVLAGIEAHVCVLQTALDLQACGFRVYVAADAVASRRKFDWKFALRRMADSGVTVTTLESVLFEWCERAGTEEFREISRLVKARDASTAG